LKRGTEEEMKQIGRSVPPLLEVVVRGVPESSMARLAKRKKGECTRNQSVSGRVRQLLDEEAHRAGRAMHFGPRCCHPVAGIPALALVHK